MFRYIVKNMNLKKSKHLTIWNAEYKIILYMIIVIYIQPKWMAHVDNKKRSEELKFV